MELAVPFGLFFLHLVSIKVVFFLGFLVLDAENLYSVHVVEQSLSGVPHMIILGIKIDYWGSQFLLLVGLMIMVFLLHFAFKKAVYVYFGVGGRVVANWLNSNCCG